MQGIALIVYTQERLLPHTRSVKDNRIRASFALCSAISKIIYRIFESLKDLARLFVKAPLFSYGDISFLILIGCIL